jgi:O-antigen/teichoic acid export membrane protein
MSFRPMLPPRDKLLHWSRKLGTFFVGQGAIQLLNLLTGFLIIRWLSVEAYAQYSLAFGFQSSVGMLVDLGFGSGVIALVGSRVNDPGVAGRYIRSVLHYRTRLFLTIAPLAAIAFVWMTGQQEWGWATRAALFGSVLFSLYFQGWTSCYSSPLAMHQRYGALYRVQVVNGVWRLGAFGALHFLSALTASCAAWVNSLSMAGLGFFYRRACRTLVREPAQADPAANLEMRRYVAPLIPATVFNALESQITVFLIACFGRTQNIAEVAALGRLTQVLIIFMAFNGTVVGPSVARASRANLRILYLASLIGGCVLVGGLWAASLLMPGPMLWIVGAKYAHLHDELPWSILGWGLYFLGTLLWTMHSARKWVFWWHSTMHCVALVVSQIVGIWLFDLGTTMGVLKFSLLAAAANLAVQMAAGVYGFWTDRAEQPPAPSWQEKEIETEIIAEISAAPLNETESPSPAPAVGGGGLLIKPGKPVL